MKNKPLAFLTLFLLALLPCFLVADVIILSNGARLEGEILQEREDRVVLDLGFQLITIPRDEISRMQSADPEAVETVVREGIYRIAENPRERSVRDNVETIGEAVVQVRTPTGLGSGFVIDPSGYIITNEHVISGERDITVILYEQRDGNLENISFRNVRIVALNPFSDLALLKVEADREFVTVPIGSSNDLRQGEIVFAVGSPLGLERSVSQGIISLRNRAIQGRLYIQTTTQINPGNSGGPLLNLRGEVVGVNNMKVSGFGVEGLGFAIPSEELKHFLHNRDAFAFDPRNPNAGFRYFTPPGEALAQDGEDLPRP
ncbi:MAG: trypsin-like peptidase domain-containing protein [Opitutales bacterium]|nr:trypsin-like peptidase domain-containing protein [Opitutales bacterium]